MRGRRSVLPIAQRLAWNAPNLVLRLSAIATVGDLGGSEVGETLAALAGEPDSLVQPAAKAAQQRWRQRLKREQATEVEK